MPELTLTLTDQDIQQLTSIGGPLQQTPRRVAERIIHRNLTKTSTTPPQTNRSRAADRATRQLALLRLVKDEYDSVVPRSLVEKKALAERFGVAQRTLYRDLDIVSEALRDEALREEIRRTAADAALAEAS